MEKQEFTHHKQQKLCATRPQYRQGKKLTAVKVYTIASESSHLYVYDVPNVNLRSELRSLFLKYGQIKGICVVPDAPSKDFTECFHIHYERIQSAKIAKKLLDNRAFYGSLIHICYAPECETVEATRQKLMHRQKDAYTRATHFENYKKHEDLEPKKKRKFDEMNETHSSYD